jgi:chromosome segregation ATPase
MSEQERAPLRDVLANAKNELLEARRELERATQQIHSQHESIQQELGSLSKLRDELVSDRAAAKHVADQSRADWENFKASLEAFGQLTRDLKKQHDAALQLVQSKDNDLKAALKALNDSAASFKENLDPDTDRKLEEIRKSQARFLATCSELEESVREAAKGNQRIDEIWKSIRDSLSQSQLRLDQLSDMASKSHATATSASAIAQQMEESYKALEGTSTQLHNSLAGIQQDVQSLSSFVTAEAERQEEIQKKLNDSAKQIKDMRDTYLTTAKDAKGKAMEALTAKREELKSSLETLDKSWQEPVKEYGEMAGLVDSAIKEIKLQREQYGASSRRLKDSVGRLLAERKALTEELAALRAEREKRLKAGTQGVCPSCGRKVASNAVFCDRCGASLL